MLKFNSITKTDGAAIRLVASQLSNSSFPRVLQALAYRFAQTHTHTHTCTRSETRTTLACHKRTAY